MTRDDVFKALKEKSLSELAWALSGVVEALYVPAERDSEDLDPDHEWSSETPVSVHSAVMHLLPAELSVSAEKDEDAYYYDDEDDDEYDDEEDDEDFSFFAFDEDEDDDDEEFD